MILFACLIGLIGYGQNINAPKLDSGYYYGVVKDSLLNKYIFMTFLSNDGDNVIHIVPYILKNDVDSSFLHDNYKNLLEQEMEDSIDGNILVDYGWNIPGFDNYCYYTIESRKLTFSLNIANIDKPYLDVFQFRGTLLDVGRRIDAVVSSTDSIFQDSELTLNYKEK